MTVNTLADNACGGAFILGESSHEDLFIPDNLSEEHRMIRDMVASFMNDKVMPNVDAIEKQENGIMKKILKEAAELGLLGAEIPEQYGGMEMDILSLMLILEQVASLASFSVSFGAHSGIGTAPVLYFGSPEVKEKYLPKLVSG